MPNALIVTRWRQWRVSIYPQVVLQQPDDDGSAHELRITVISASERERERENYTRTRYPDLGNQNYYICQRGNLAEIIYRWSR